MHTPVCSHGNIHKLCKHNRDLGLYLDIQVYTKLKVLWEWMIKNIYAMNLKTHEKVPMRLKHKNGGEYDENVMLSFHTLRE